MSNDIKKRPYTESEYLGGGATHYVCAFCGAYCNDQTLESWESCCRAFELVCERDELRAENERLHASRAAFLTPEDIGMERYRPKALDRLGYSGDLWRFPDE